MNYENILARYDKQIAELIYKEATELLSEFSDEELSELFVKYPDSFKKVINKKKEDLLNRVEDIYSIIDILTNALEHRNLTIQDYNKMSLDEVHSYISKLITDKTPLVFNIINTLENDARNHSN